MKAKVLFKNRYFRAVLITFLLIAIALLANMHDGFNAYYVVPIQWCIILSCIGLLLPESESRLVRLIETVFVVALIVHFTYLEMEMWQGNNLGIPFDGEEMMKIRKLLNWGLIAVFLIAGMALFRRPWMGLFTVTTLFTIIGLISYIVLQFRGEVLLPSDVSALETAIDIAASYHLKIYSNFVAALLCYIVSLIWIRRLRSPAGSWDRKTTNCVRASLALIVLISLWSFDMFPVEEYFYPWFIQNNGYTYSVMMNLKLLHVKKDSSYDATEIGDRLERAEGAFPILGTSFNPEASIAKSFPNVTEENPNIICIMNESFADLSVLGDFETDKPVLPNWNALKKESISGDLVVEVFGSGTSDTEYSFLTSNSTMLFADNARAYELYIDEGVSALPKRLKKQGYDTVAVHPDNPKNWNRDKVYPMLGFDEFLTKEDFPNSQIIRDYYTSDRDTYKKVEEIFKNKGDNPLFVFDVTLQNHGSYNQSYNNLDPVHLTEPDGNYLNTEQYLSLARESDKAFGELINYFKKVKEPTVVLMFGDHMPKVDDSFFTEMLGSNLDSLSLEDQRKRYTTPFMIWANYDIPAKEIDEISVNYLSTLLTEVTGTEKTQYDRYLEELHKVFPVVDKKGVKTEKGEELAFTELEGKNRDRIELYKNMIYNNVFDKKEKCAKYYDRTANH